MSDENERLTLLPGPSPGRCQCCQERVDQEDGEARGEQGCRQKGCAKALVEVTMWYILGAIVLTVYVFIYACCKVASDADDFSERVMYKMIINEALHRLCDDWEAKGARIKGR